MATERWKDDADWEPPRHQSMLKPPPAAWFVWEDTPGLDHHCPVCGVPNSHAGTLLNICLGEHVMPCPKYHQNLFWPNKTHECDPCNRSREEHFKRHKAIAISLRELGRLTGSGHSGSDSPPSPSESDWAEGDGATQQRRRKQNKLAKKLDKALSRKPPPDTIAGADVARVALAFHPDADDRHEAGDQHFIELDDPDFPDNVRWDGRGYAWYRRQVDVTGTVISPDFDELAAAALRRLNVDVPSHATPKQKLTKDQKSVVNQLLALAKGDFEHLWNEEVETAKRRGGFLRFIRASALDRIKESRKERLEYATRQRRADEPDRAIDRVLHVQDANDQVQDDFHEEFPPRNVLNHPEAEPANALGIDFPADEPEDNIPGDTFEGTATVQKEESDPTVFNFGSGSDNAKPKKQEGKVSTRALCEYGSTRCYLTGCQEIAKASEHAAALPVLTRPEEIPLPPPNKKELIEWEAEASKAKFRYTLNNTPPRAERFLDAKDFFQAGVYNMFNHDIWATPRDTPLEPRPDPEKDFLVTDSMHHIDHLHPRHDDWKAFTKHLGRYKPHPWQTASYDAHKSPDYSVPSKLSAARLVVPMGEEVFMTEQQYVAAIRATIDGGAPGCPEGHVCMMMHNTIVPFAFDASQMAPAYLVDQFSRGDGFLAEQCWQYHLFGRLNQKNLALRDGLRRKRDLALYDPRLATFTPLEAAQLARLEGPLNDSRVPRTCICHGLETARMITCDNVLCPDGGAVHARCMDIDYAPGEGERHFCHSCAGDVLWFMSEDRAKRRAAVAITKLPPPAVERDYARVAELVCQVLRILHNQAGPRQFERIVPVEVIAADVVGTMDACVDKGVATPDPWLLVSRILSDWTLDGHVRSQERSLLDFCDVCAGEHGRSTRHLPESKRVKVEKNVKISAVRTLNQGSGKNAAEDWNGQDDGKKGEKRAKGKIEEGEENGETAAEEGGGECVEFELEWQALELGSDARRLYHSDPVLSAESVVGWEKLVKQR
ncbi:putative zinc finger ring fyve phd-type protein [Diplodia seriata]|uniref:Putative zinc finger ring fyve phd-type protein n=1 Tax=Diplodia seriata TaxID=420778 RepID=A0A0G2GRD3_9PEZI|nr:putative zinc finger ring fyve phd-type protein [Diplodia seriata]